MSEVDFQTIRDLATKTFGKTEIESIDKLTGGLYNEVYKVVFENSSFVLRIAPKQNQQIRTENMLMRNEYASAPYFTVISHLMPTIVFADWTHTILDRDYMWQEFMPGIPAREGIKNFSENTKQKFYQSIGTVLAKVHSTKNSHYGYVSGKPFDRWSEYVAVWVENLIADTEDIDYLPCELRKVQFLIEKNKFIFDTDLTPTLLHGDLWIQNILIDSDLENPVFTAVLDNDRALWGDPLADWSFHMVERMEGNFKDAFYFGYGQAVESDNDNWKLLVYFALHLGTILLEMIRFGSKEKVEKYRQELNEVIKKVLNDS